MGVFDIFKRKREPPAAPRRVINSPAWNSWQRGDYTLQNSELIFSAVSRLSNSLASMPIRLYKGAEIVRNDLSELLELSPNAAMTASTFIKAFEACKDTNGNAYALKVVDENLRITRLDLLDPDRIVPVLDTDTQEMYYRISPPDGNEFYLSGWYVLHVPYVSTNGMTGVNPISVLMDTLNYSGQVQKLSVTQLEKGMNAKVVIESPANLGEGQRADAIDDLMATYRETGGSLLMLESGLKASTLNLSPVDARLFEVEKITRSKVAMVYNIPPHMMGDYSDTSFSSQEQQMLEFLQLTILPIVTAYEQEFNKKLLTAEQRRQGMHFRFSMDALLRADAATMAEVNQKAVRGGWALINEIRASRGERPVTGGDVPLVSRDLVPLDYAIKNPAKGGSEWKG